MGKVSSTNVVKFILGESFENCDSLTLRLEKFVVFEKDADKVNEIKRICNCATRAGAVRPPVACLHRIHGAREFVFELQSRLLLNHSGGVLENTGLCLHRLFGTPMIPGSSQKGIARQYALNQVLQAVSIQKKTEALFKMALTFGWADNEWMEKRSKDVMSDFMCVSGERWQEVWKDCAMALIRTLGLTLPEKLKQKPWKVLGNFSGAVAFLPAMGICRDKERILDVDVINCHHSEYYQSPNPEKLACDTENPIPNFFPAVRAGLNFVFVIAPAPAVETRLKDVEPYLDFGQDCLCNGLSEHGIGAKTNAGYGWLERNDDQLNKWLENRKMREAEWQKQLAVGRMSPEEKALHDFIQNLGSGDQLSAAKGKISTIDQLSEDEQRLLCCAFKTKFLTAWQADCQEAAKAKGADDKKYGKAFKRVDKLRKVAEKLGETMP